MTGKRNQGRRQVCLNFGVKASMVLLLGSFVSGCASTDQNSVSNTSLSAPMQVAVVTPEPLPLDPKDPWRDLIAEASGRFDVPEQWIRAVMHRESGGRATVKGKAITSPAGAVGLMQVMPATYAELRNRHGLGPTPSDPRDNIMAGTAYLREMYDQFGSPGFLAAYNCGPACFTAVQAGRQRLPKETRQYVAALAPVVAKTAPRGTGGDTALTAVVVAATEPPKPVSQPEELVQVASAAPPEPEKPVVVPASTPVVVPVAVQAEPARVEPVRIEPIRIRIENPASYDVASLDDEDYVPRPATRAHARESEPKVVMRFTPVGGSEACGSLRKVAGACQAIDRPVEHPGRS
jgi:Transglycosylase SLT domain